MKKNVILSNLLLTVIIVLSSCVEKIDVSMESLLTDMKNRGSIAEFPSPIFKLQQVSSYNRISTSPEDSVGWFANNDFNSKPSDKKFLRIDTVNGKKEWVLMDHQSPGAIVRTWMPFPNANKPETKTVIKIYLDGDTIPVIEGNMLDVFNGKGVIPYPFAHQSLRSAVSFFPITYAKSCKVTTTACPSFYQITYREYPLETKVKTFTKNDFEKNKLLIDEVGKTLISDDIDLLFSTNNISEMKKEKLKPNEDLRINLSKTNSAIKALSINITPSDIPDTLITENVFIRISFDGKETVYSPIGSFFGTGMGLNPFKDYYREVTPDFSFISKWVMPFKKNAEIVIENKLETELPVELQLVTTDYEWTDKTMYFHASYRNDSYVPTRPFSDWNYVTLNGKGVYVGDALTVYNPVKKWWGEGDEKIWVDNEAFPSLFGTGTEDYYGYSWGGISTDFYEHPFHGQPRCNVYNKLNRKKDVKERNTQGYSTEVRVRSLDGIVFNESLKLDMEVWSWTDCVMKYSVGTAWYMMPE